MTLFHELKRRKVVRTTLAYLAGAFVVAQAAQLLVEGLELPGWILKVVLITAVVLLPLVVGLAWAFDLTPDGVERTALDPKESKVTLPWRRVALPVTASLLLLTASIAFLSLNDSAERPLNQHLLAVMPFRVSGDPDLAYLREGMVDLLAAKLTGEGGPRAADPRAVLSAVKQESDEEDVAEAVAAGIARQLGAGRVLVGSLVGTAQQFQISAKILAVPSGQVIAQEEQSGSADSLLMTVDRLVAKLLSLQAGEGPQRLEQLTTTSLPALRAYLDGQAAYRSGHFGRASELFGRAVAIDSTFALAALGQELAAGWGEGPTVDTNRLRRIMFQNRDRLGPVDRALVTATVGEQLGVRRSFARRIADYRIAVDLAPDRADAWFVYGDILAHWGVVAGYLDAAERADAAFSRVLELDSTYMPALLHRMDLAHLMHHRDRFMELEKIRKRRDPDGSAAIYQASLRNHILRDTAAIAAELAALDTVSTDRLNFMLWDGFAGGAGVDQAVRALDRLLQTAQTTDQQIEAHWLNAAYALEYGMPARAARAMDVLIEIDQERLAARAYQMLAALYGNGDTTRAAVAAVDMSALLRQDLPAWQRIGGLCALLHWRLWHDDTSGYREALQYMERVPADSTGNRQHADVCARSVTAIHALKQDAARLNSAVRALDAALRDGPPVDGTLRNVSNIVLARTAEAAGDRKLAFHAAARIPVHPRGGWFQAQMLRESARLAALNGDVERATRNYTTYLNTHERAESSLTGEVHTARAHLTQLTAKDR